LLADRYFAALPPKSLDRNHFAARDLDVLSTGDAAATLAAFTVEAVAAAQRFAAEPPACWIVTGGGRRNPTILKGLSERLAGKVLTAEEAGFDGDAIEAEAWAYLGVRSVLGAPISFPGTTGVAQELTGGVVVRKGTR